LPLAERVDLRQGRLCQSCGACCVAEWEGQEVYADVEPAEVRRIPHPLRNLLVGNHTKDWGFSRYATRTKEAHGRTVCAALRGEAGQSTACIIYASRPAVCADFKPGSTECLDAREAVGLDV